jgi:PAS domain S-box-containing protein
MLPSNMLLLNLILLIDVTFSTPTSNDAIFGKDLSGIINSWNQGAERLYGYRAAEIIGKPVAILIPEDLQQEASQFLREIARGRLVTREETVRRRADGSLVYVSLVISPIRDSTGQIVGASSVAHDISERKRAEDELRASEDRYRDLVEHSQDLICTHDLSGKFLSANPAPARVLGYSVDEMLKIPMRDIIAPEFRGQFDQYLVRIRSHGADKGMMAVLTRSGERRIWEYHNTPRTEGVDTPVVRGLARDVTEKVRAVAALRESEARLNEAQHSAHVGSWTYRPGKPFTVSDELYELFKLPRDVVPTQETLLSRIHPDDYAHCATSFQRCLESGDDC